MNTSPSESGFALVEILMIVVILAIIGSVGYHYVFIESQQEDAVVAAGTEGLAAEPASQQADPATDQASQQADPAADQAMVEGGDMDAEMAKQRLKALGTEAKATARLAQQTMEACAASDIYGRYTECTIAALQAEEPTLTQGDISARLTATPSEESYVITMGTQPLPDTGDVVTYTIEKSQQGVDRTCTSHPVLCEAGNW